MTKNKHIPVLLCAAIISVVLCAWIVQSVGKPPGRIETKLLQGKTGWGYDIIVDGRTVIHQPGMPAYGGSQGFGNKTQASHAASLVVSRLGQRDFPGLSKQEVDSINTRYHE